jgi:phospholipid/cholesterol/gamma-HCH transport system ATP-binding protein
VYSSTLHCNYPESNYSPLLWVLAILCHIKQYHLTRDAKIKGMSMSGQDVIALEKLTYYRGQKLIFEQLDLVVETGKITAIMGPSGCGKTTLLRLIGGQLQPHSGTIHILGKDLQQLNRRELSRLRSRMGVLFQSGALFTDLNVFENVAFPMREHGNLTEEQLSEQVLLKLDAVGLRSARHLFPAQLSGGMARRIALARAVAMNPEVVFYDEPFAGQDPIATTAVMRLIQSLAQAQGHTSVLVSHDLAETCAIADHIILLGHGRMLAQGTPTQLLASEDPVVQQFTRGEVDSMMPLYDSI